MSWKCPKCLRVMELRIGTIYEIEDFCSSCGTARPVEKKPVLKRYEIKENQCKVMVFKHPLQGDLDIVWAYRSSAFRNGYFELNDGTKSKVPYLFHNKREPFDYQTFLEINENVENWEMIYPVAVWLEETEAK